MNKNIVFFDIDGTLIDETTRKIPQSAKDAIKRLRENGHLAFINTGRTIIKTRHAIKDLEFDGYVCGCGTYLEYNNKVLFYKTIDSKTRLQIISDLKEYKLEGVLEGRDKIYFDNEENISNKDILSILNMSKKRNIIEGNWYEDNLVFDKFVIFLKEDSNFDGFHSKYSKDFDFIKRSDDFFEVVPKGCSKATGIKHLIEHLNIPHQNTYAIGDSTNDLSMLEYSHKSIAMGNSNPVLFEKVSFITKSVTEHGISHALSHFNMI